MQRSVSNRPWPPESPVRGSSERSASPDKSLSGRPASVSYSPATRWRADSTPFADASNHQAGSPLRTRVDSQGTSSSYDKGSSPERPSSRALSSSIMSSRDRRLSLYGNESPAIQSPFPQSPGRDRTLSASVGRSMGHRRAMTLPQLGFDPVDRSGSPKPDGSDFATAEGYVPGLPGRARLARPADSASPYAPSAVFQSSHGSYVSHSPLGLPPTPPRSRTMLLPSQAVKAIDRQRRDLVAYEYLCHLAEARDWLEAHITTRADPSQPLWGDSITDFEKSLRNGYALAHLARSLGGPSCQGPIYSEPSRDIRHIDNINIFFKLLSETGLPEIFRFESVDLYDGKNIPKVIYCIHALSHLLARRGLAEGIDDLAGQIEFTDAEVGAAQKGLNEAGVRMPNFSGIGRALDRHEGGPTAPSTEEQERAESARRAAEQERQRAAAEAAAAEAAAAEAAAAEEERRRAEAEVAAAEAARKRAAELEREQAAAVEEERRRRQAAAEEAQRAAVAAAAAEEERRQAALQEATRVIPGFQAIVRGAQQRGRFFEHVDRIDAQEPAFVALQAVARGHLSRRALSTKLVSLDDRQGAIAGIQAVSRGVLVRRRVAADVSQLAEAAPAVIRLQAQLRGCLARQIHRSKTLHLRKTATVRSVGGLQSIARAALARRQVQSQRQALDFVKPDVVGIQAHLRMWLRRVNFLARREHVQLHEGNVILLQSLLRGSLARQRDWSLRYRLSGNAHTTACLQALIRSRRQQSRYNELRIGTNVSVDTVRSFMHLLDDSHHDYLGDLQVESMRKEVIGCIRELHELEEDVKDLDIKIALLVKNKITHEVARAQRSKAGSSHLSKRGSPTAGQDDPFAGDVLDHHTRRKLELYQQLFWHLQTQPAYLARLSSILPQLSLREKMQRQLEATIFVIFGYAQGSREEYLWLQFLRAAAVEELRHTQDLASFATGNFTFLRVLAHYARGPALRAYFDRCLTSAIRAVASRADVDLDTDPVAIYRQEISREEASSGVPSRRPKEVDYARALADQGTNAVFIQHLISLRKATSAFLRAIFDSRDSMPFGVRSMARELYRALQARFPDAAEQECLRVVGNLIYYRLLQPAILAPETYGIVDGAIAPLQRQNLAQICKLLNQISVGRLFGQEQRYLVPMNEYIEASAQDYQEWVRQVIDVTDAEAFYGVDAHQEAASGRVPVIYISPVDIYALHCILADQLHAIAPLDSDPVRAIIHELGSVPAESASVDTAHDPNSAVTLSLVTHASPEEGPASASRLLLEQTKRRVLAVLKVHPGSDLEAVLAREVTEDDEDEWAGIAEMHARRAAQEQAQNRPLVQQPDDLYEMSFHQVKMATLGDILRLRQLDLVSKSDKYQGILNGIAQDIRSKHQRRLRRQNELASLHTTLLSLREKKQYYVEQIDSYHVYIDQSMAGIQKKSQKRIVLPWTMQGSHERQLEREGRSYRFGSYKYSAQTLYDRGVLLSVDSYSPRQFDKVTLTISSDDVGEFEFSLGLGAVKATPVKLRLDDILEAQFVGRQTISLGEVARCNLNLLLDLINRKFYA